MPPVKKQKPKKEKAATENIVPEEKIAISGQLNKKLQKKQVKEENQRGVVFIKHLPHGFFEAQLKQYFQQFGHVTRLRLARSRKSGGSKGYAFVEFKYPEVAQVAAETMDNYLMFQKIVKAQYIPPEKQRFNYFKSTVRKVKDKTGKTVYVSCKTAAIQRRTKKFNDWSVDAYQQRTALKLKKINKLKEKYAHLGIDFSKIIIGPKKIESKEEPTSETKVESEAVTQEDQATAAGSSKSNNKNKRKLTKEVKKDTVSEIKKGKTANESIKLEDLLGNTINDDSSDEDYIALAENDEDDEIESDTSNEESYGFLKDVSDEDIEDSEESPIKNKSKKTSLKSSSKSVKANKKDVFEQLIKRKPQSGGIQKKGKKNIKPAAPKTKNLMKINAAKAVAKPLVALKPKKAKAKK